MYSKKAPNQKMGRSVPESLAKQWQKLRKQPAVSVAWVADRLGLSSGRPRQLTDEGVITRRTGGKCGPENILEYVCWLRDRADARDQSSRGQIEQEKLRALRRENDLAERRLFPPEILQAALERTVSAWIVVLDNVTVEWKRKFPATSGDELEQIKKFVAELRNALAQAAIDVEDPD